MCLMKVISCAMDRVWAWLLHSTVRDARFLGVFRMNSDRHRIELLPVVTLVIWLACLVVGLVGHFILVSSPAEPIPPWKPTEATLVNVSLTDSPAAASAVDAAPVLPDAPPLPQVA